MCSGAYICSVAWGGLCYIVASICCYSFLNPPYLDFDGFTASGCIYVVGSVFLLYADWSEWNLARKLLKKIRRQKRKNAAKNNREFVLVPSQITKKPNNDEEDEEDLEQQCHISLRVQGLCCCGSVCYLIGSFGFIPKLGIPLVGAWGFIIGGFILFVAYAYKVSRILKQQHEKAAQTTSPTAAASPSPSPSSLAWWLDICIEVSGSLSGAFFFVGTLIWLPYFRFAPDLPVHLWVVASIFLVLPPLIMIVRPFVSYEYQ